MEGGDTHLLFVSQLGQFSQCLWEGVCHTIPQEQGDISMSALLFWDNTARSLQFRSLCSPQNV